MATTRTIIDVHNDRLSMTVLGENVQLDVFNVMSLPSYAYDDCLIIDETKENFDEQLSELHREKYEIALIEDMLDGENGDFFEEEDAYIENGAHDDFADKKEELELKELPEHLKYVVLGENNTKPVIISSILSSSQENRLVAELKKKKEAIGWSLDDKLGINPAKCMHRIDLEPDAKLVRDF